ncbi:hypothetical protein N7468_007877 [Penicillium chermesinum]|uniref:Uncharacterized protein n=1 Tax=Penicillium chermesinum TaxID=63820 RepID=A0A9W9NNV9_9EURO|nr:uncharacterized protein N7468_007877 [Penicillium chermesinum]KAJ5223335.1 hypothetical protein N7468_007877 [Penicillium chermesinum]KAJ6155826.1 hypothetical protein N7470_006392 [Penicillium chermesinum]
MVRGAEYDNGIPQSDNPIEAGETKAHGVGNSDAPLEHTKKVAPMPEYTESNPEVFGGLANTNPNNSGSGKGGHEPKSLGEKKGLGSLPGN